MSLGPPRVSVIVATLRRPESLPLAVGSILACAHDSFELLIADQNEDGDTARQLRAYLGDPRLHLVGMPPVGLSQGQNLAVAHARGQILLFTDDDCQVPQDWITQTEAAFERHPQAGLLFGEVVAGPHDATKGFIPCVQRPAERVWRYVTDKPALEVMGACMAIRKAAWDLLIGFPSEIGPGKPTSAGGDYDIALRALLQGISVLETPAVWVLHHGFRDWPRAQALLEGYAYSTALVLALRTARHPTIFLRSLQAYWQSYWRNQSSIVASARLSKETHAMSAGIRPRRLRAFVRGLARGIRMAYLPKHTVHPA